LLPYAKCQIDAGSRYIFHGESSKETFEVQQKIIIDEPHKPDYTTGLTWLPTNIKDFILPAGFPGNDGIT